jgi:alcohol dehydrogenase class IV
LDKNFTIQLPKKIIFGEDVVKNVPELAKQFNAKSVLFMTDPTISKIGLSSKVVNPLQEAGIKVEIYDKVEPEPSLKAAEQVMKVARDASYDLVIGMGGGSSLDMGKLASISATNLGPIADYIGVGNIPLPGLPKILIPTTSGTGSEITMNLIISHKEEGRKMGLVDPHIITDVAVIDPLLTISMPPKVTAATGLDALTHAVESLMSIDLNPFTEPLAIDAVKLIFRSLKKAYDKGDSVEARRDMSLASMLAGTSLAISGVCAGHAAAYAFTVQVPHGVGCGLALPYTMELNAPNCLPKLAAIAEAAGVNRLGESQENNAFYAVSGVRKLMEGVNFPISLIDIGIKEEDIDIMATRMLKVTRLLAHNPRELTMEDAINLFQRMYEGKPLPLSEYSKS